MQNTFILRQNVVCAYTFQIAQNSNRWQSAQRNQTAARGVYAASPFAIPQVNQSALACLDAESV